MRDERRTLKDRVALRAFHVCPAAHVVVVFKNGAVRYFGSVGDFVHAVPASVSGYVLYTASFVLGDALWWKWIKHLYRGRVPWRSEPRGEEEK